MHIPVVETFWAILLYTYGAYEYVTYYSFCVYTVMQIGKDVHLAIEKQADDAEALSKLEIEGVQNLKDETLERRFQIMFNRTARNDFKIFLAPREATRSRIYSSGTSSGWRKDRWLTVFRAWKQQLFSLCQSSDLPVAYHLTSRKATDYFIS